MSSERFQQHLPKGASTVELIEQFSSKNILFYVEKSENTNCVVYEANLLDSGKLDQKEPVKTYWILYARDPVVEEGLNLIERNTAYGINVSHDEKGEFTIHLSALPSYKISLSQDKDFNTLSAVIEIEGERRELIGVYVKVKYTLMVPFVEYVDIKTKSLEDQSVKVSRVTKP